MSEGQINIHSRNENAFIEACSNGHLEIVKLLLSFEQTHGQINIHENDEQAFVKACLHGHSDIVKLLLSLEITHGKLNIDNWYEYLFFMICLRGYVDIILIFIDMNNNLDIYKDICYKNNFKSLYLLIQIKRNKIEDNKEIIKLEIDNCVICNNNNKYFFEYECNINHLICIDCVIKYKCCYYCRNKQINCDKLYINLKN